MAIDLKKHEKGVFMVTVQAIVYDPKTNKILIALRKKDPHVRKLSWTFIGGRAHYDELEKSVKKHVKDHTGLTVKVRKVIHAKTYPEERKIVSIYFMTAKVSGKLKSSSKFEELKWVKPTAVRSHFTTSLHKDVLKFLKELEVGKHS